VIRIRISPGALQDLNEGFLFYEAQGLGLGDYFVSSLRADIEGLRVTAGVHRVVFRDYHRLLSRLFPYGIFYSNEGDDVAIWAIIDLRREPAWIRDRLNQ
jgi:plasmid stabilization system protein ParE